MDFRHLIVTCLFSKLRLPFDNQKVKENYAIFTCNTKVFLQQESVSKRNRPIPSSAVGAGFACPKTQSKLFSGEQTSPLRTKRQHYPHFEFNYKVCTYASGYTYGGISLHVYTHRATHIYA